VQVPGRQLVNAELGQSATAWMPSGPTRWRKFPEQGPALPKPGIGYVV